MTKNDLEQFRHLKNEILLLKKELNAMNRVTTMDSVTGSSPDFPYVKHVITITGTCSNHVLRMQRRIDRKITLLQDEIERLNQFIDTIDDSEMRQIFILRYRSGLSWQGVARNLGNAGDGSTERKKHDRFLNFPPIPEKSEVL